MLELFSYPMAAVMSDKANEGVVCVSEHSPSMLLNHCLQWDKLVLRTHPLQPWSNIYLHIIIMSYKCSTYLC